MSAAGIDYYDDGLPMDEWVPPDDEADARLVQELQFNRDVRDEVHRLRVRAAAREAHAREQAASDPGPSFDAGSLADILARPAPPPMRAEGIIPSEAGVLVVAQRKTGKTTLELNYARALLTGEDFLGRFAVRPVAGTVAILNYEVSGHTLASWASDQGLPGDRLWLVNLRGRRNPLAHDEDRASLADWLRARQVEAVIVDPFGRAYTGQNQNDPGEVGSWLVRLDYFARAEVGATDVVLSAHAGWNGERARGASALEDWADSVITLTRNPDDEQARFLRAEGRDVLVDEDRIDFDPHTRTLTLAGVGSRRQVKDDDRIATLATYVLRAVRDVEGRSTSSIEAAVRDMEDAPSFRNGEVSKAAKYLAARSHIRLEPGGAGRPTLHYLSQPLPTSPGDGLRTSPTSPYRGEVRMGRGSEPDLSPNLRLIEADS